MQLLRPWVRAYTFGIVTLLAAQQAISAHPESTQKHKKDFDVVVVSGSSGGFGAALAAGRLGAHVALVEDTPVLGGMLSNGISNIDTFSYESLSGIFEEFRHRVKDYYSRDSESDPIFKMKHHPSEAMDGRSQQSNLPIDGGRWEPRVAATIFRSMIAEVPNVEVFYNETPTDVVMSGNRITCITALSKEGSETAFCGKVIIDATHEGDIAAWAGVPYSIGREARSALEPHAGRISYFNWTGEMLPGSTGEQDRAIPSSGFRLTVKNYGASGQKAPLLAQPAGYHAEDYKASGNFKFSEGVPQNKTEFNVNPIGTELPGANWDWPELKPLERGALKQKYLNHALGYLYYLQHDLGHIEIGLSDDDYADNGNVPYRMFLREGRRIHGEATMTEADINPFILGDSLNVPFHANSIGVGHYPIDAKPVREKIDLTTPDKGEGDFFLANTTQPFQIPYGAIVPQKVEGLLVPVALSATHVAFSAIRMDPTWMELGQAAGTAAVLSIKQHTIVRQISIASLQESLLQQHCRLVFFWDVALADPYFASIDGFSLLARYDGGNTHEFHPDQPLTRATFADWLVHTQGLSPSVSNQHFRDVPWTHAQFREIETLFDAEELRALGVESQWPRFGSYSQEKFGGFSQAMAFTDFHPNQPVTWTELVRTLQALEAGTVAVSSKTDERAWLSELMHGSPLETSTIDLNAAPRRKETAAVLVAYFHRNKK